LSSAASAQQTGYFTTSDSARIYYKIAPSGAPGADTIIAIHGGPGMDLESIYGDFAPALGRNHVVIFYDQRGGGRSELPKDTTRLFAPRQVQDLEELRQHFKLRQVTLIAHSYGPLLAASYAIAHPQNVKKMIFFGPVPPRRGDFWTRYSQNLGARLTTDQRAQMSAASRRQNDSTLSDADSRAGCRAYWALGVRPRLGEPDVTASQIRSDFCVTDINGLRYGSRIGNRVIMGSYGDWDLRPQLKNLQVPLLVVHGTEETIPMDLVQEWITAMPAGKAWIVKVARAAHFAYAERPTVAWTSVESFLNGTMPTP
jgi:proline iminopeptidase